MAIPTAHYVANFCFGTNGFISKVKKQTSDKKLEAENKPKK